MGMDPTRAVRAVRGERWRYFEREGSPLVLTGLSGLLGAGIALLSVKLRWGCFGWRGNPPAFQQISGRSLRAVRSGGYFG